MSGVRTQCLQNRSLLLYCFSKLLNARCFKVDRNDFPVEQHQVCLYNGHSILCKVCTHFQIKYYLENFRLQAIKIICNFKLETFVCKNWSRRLSIFIVYFFMFAYLGYFLTPNLCRNVGEPQPDDMALRVRRQFLSDFHNSLRIAVCFSWFLSWSILWPWKWRQYIAPKH
jgi:hypothetical protein